MKHKKLASIISLFLVLLLILPFSARAVTQSDIDRVQEERDRLEQEQKETQAKIDELKEKKA